MTITLAIAFNWTFGLTLSGAPRAGRDARLINGRINDPNRKTNVPPFQAARTNAF